MSSTGQTRRDFLKDSVAMASAAALAGLSVGQVAHAAGSDTIRIGMIGCGGRCSGAALDAMEADKGVRLVAMCDLFMDRVEGKLESLKGQKPAQVDVDREHRYASLDGYRHVIDGVDAVLIACAAKFHPMYMHAAIDAGKHVFVEKPHAIDPPGIRRVMAALELAKQKRVSVVSGLHRRFDLGMQETIKRIRDGAIGDIVAIEENFLRGPYGVITHRPPGIPELQFQYGNQYRFSWLCGDDVTQSLVHNLDRATWAMGEQVPVKCHGLAGRSTCYDLPHVYGDVLDHHSVVYQYANGVRMYALCRTTPNCYDEVSGIIMGTKGTAYTENYRIDGQSKWRYEGPNPSAYRVEHEHFFRSIRAGSPLICDYMARSTMVAIMGQLSCYSGKEMTWDRAMKSEFYFKPRPEECTATMEPPVLPDAKGVYPVAIPGKTVIG